MTGEKRMLFALALVAAVLAAMNGAAFLAEDREGPSIFFPEESPVYTASMPESSLLDQVTAEDRRDGTVTDSLRVEEIFAGRRWKAGYGNLYCQGQQRKRGESRTQSFGGYR